MTQKKQLSLLLALLIVLLSGYGIFTILEKNSMPPAEEEASGSSAIQTWDLTNLDETEVRTIEFSNENGRFTLERSDDDWTVKDNSQIKLDPRMISQAVLPLMHMYSIEKIEGGDISFSEYGITGDSRHLKITTTEGREILMKIGSPNPAGSGFYVNIEGEPEIHILPNSISWKLLIDLDSLRDRSLPSIDPSNLSYLKIDGSETIEIVPFYEFDPFLSTMSSMLMIQPYDPPVAVDNEAYGKAMESFFQGLTIRSFVDEGTSLETTGLDSSAKRLYMKDHGGSELTLLIGKENAEEEVYCAIPGREGIFTLAKETLALADLKPFDLADRFVRLVPLDRVQGFRIEGKGQVWEGHFVRQDEDNADYYFQGQPIEEGPFKKIYQQILYLLTEGEIQGSFTAGEPEFSVTYIGREDSNPGSTTIEFYPYNRDYYAFSVDGRPPRFLIGRYQIDGLVKYLENPEQ